MSGEEYKLAVQRLSHELTAYRAGQTRRSGRLPERFWNSATVLVEHSSIEKVAEATGLSAEGLKKRSATRAGGVQSPSFVELLLPPTANNVQCVIKVESASGARMQCEVGSLDAAGLAAVIREFAR